MIGNARKWVFFLACIVVGSAAAATNSVAGINVMKDCSGVVGNGQTDDAPAIQTCIDQNPGAEIFLPKTQPYPNASYFLRATLVPKGSGMMIRGESSGWANSTGLEGGGTVLRFAPLVTGIAFPSQNPGFESAASDPTPSGNVTLHISASPKIISQYIWPGNVVTDLTHAAAVPPDTVVAAVDSKTQTVTMSQGAAGSGLQTNDVIAFTIPGQSATTTSPTGKGQNILCFSTVPPAAIITGSGVTDLTDQRAITGGAYVTAVGSGVPPCSTAVTISAPAASVVSTGSLIAFANACQFCGAEYLTLIGGEPNDYLGSSEHLIFPAGTSLGNSSRAIEKIQRTQTPEGPTVTVAIFPGYASSAPYYSGKEGLTQQVGSTVQISGVTYDPSLNGLCVITGLAPGRVGAIDGTSTNPLIFTCTQAGLPSGPYPSNITNPPAPVGIVGLPTTGPSTADGMKICGNFTVVNRVVIQSFGRHGINIDNSECFYASSPVGAGFNVSRSDDTIVTASMLVGNQGEGLYCHGNNCNAGVFRDNFFYYNSLWAIEDQGRQSRRTKPATTVRGMPLAQTSHRQRQRRAARYRDCIPRRLSRSPGFHAPLGALSRSLRRSPMDFCRVRRWLLPELLTRPSTLQTT